MKKLKKILLYLIISVILILPIISSDIQVSDLYFHYGRIQAITSSLRNGIIKEWIYSDYYKYNYAAGIFYPDFLIIPFCLLTFLHISDLSIFCITLILSNFITLFIAEYFSKKVLVDYKCDDVDKNATLIAILYLLSPRMIIEIISQAFSRIIIQMFIPIIAYAIYTFFKKEKKNNWVLLSLGMTLCLYCHLITTVIICFGIAIIYIFNIKNINKNIIIDTIKAALLSIILTCCVWLPVLEGYAKNNLKIQTHPAYSDITKSCVKFTNINNTYIKLIIFIIIFLVLMAYYKKIHSIKAMNICILLWITYMLTTLFPWEFFANIFPIFNTIQFTNRFMIFESIPLALILYHHKYASRTYILIFLFSMILLSAASPIYTDSYLNNKIYNSGIENVYGLGAEFMPNEFYEYLTTLDDRNSFEINCHFKNDDGTLTYEKNHNISTVKYVAKNDDTIIVPMYSYYGYKIYINGKQTSYSSDKGFVSINVRKGEGTIIIKNVPTVLQNLSLIISSIGWIVFFIIIKIQQKMVFTKNRNNDIIYQKI